MRSSSAAPFRLSFLFPVVALACGGTETASPEGSVVTDSAGVRIVESRSPVWGDGTARIDPEPLLRIGREEPGPYQFSAVPFGLLLDGGGIAVVAQQAGQVRVFDSAGDHLRSFGRAGEGPGEFGVIAGLFRYDADSIAVYDARLYRTTLLPSTSFDSYRTVSNGAQGNYVMFGTPTGGPLLLYNPGRGFRPDLEAGLQWTTSDVVAVDASDGSTRTITTLPSRQQLVEPNGDTGLVIPPLYAIHAAAEDGFYWATPDRYAIGFYDREGTLRRILRRPVDPEPLTPAVIESYIEANLEATSRFAPKDALPQIRSSFEEASHGESVPLFGTALVDGDGRLWVSGPALLAVPPSHWTLFAPDGAWLGDLEAPERVSILDALGDTVLGVWRDELDVPYVQLHRIVR